LLEELIDVHEIGLGADSWQGESVLVLRHMSTVMVTAMAVNRNERWSGWDIRDATTVDWKSLKSHQALSDLSIGVGINGAALGITKELVQGIVSTLASVVGSMLAEVTTVADWVVDWGIRRWLWLRSIVPVVG
jgi:hypothetical protein